MISSINTRKGALACPGPASPPIKLRFRNSISRKKDISHVIRSTETPDQISYEDPEKKFRRYGPNFGSQHQINEPLHWLKDMPRMWMRSKEHRKHDELIELIVLNERLSGNMPAWEARQRLEYLKLRRKNWEAIYDYITRTDAAATLALVEEANSKVEEALMDDVQEQTGVGALQTKLLELQGEVNEARVKLQVSQGRLDQNLQRVNELKAEAAALERIRLSSPSADSAAVQLMPEEASASSQKARRAAGPRSSERRGNKSLQSSLEIEDGLRNFWYPAEFSKKLQPNTLVPFEMFNKSWVLFRDNNGQPACLRDSCAHRACPLSLGKVKDGQVQCAYHGWEFNAEGTCTKMPSVAGVCKDVGVAAMPCAEKDGFVWVWPGAGAPTMDVPDFAAPPAGFSIHAEVMVEVPVEHGLLMENLLDLAHAPFTHTSTFAKGWPVPEVVRFHTTKMLSGNWDPYPISMAFQPPCMVLSTIGLSQPGKIERGLTADQCKRHLHQLHVCMPSKTGHTRLLYRMSMDFWQWAQNLPFLERVWKKVAEQVLAEDYVLVKGQQDRMAEGENTWNCPMAYDKLAVRYRRWRNSVAAGEYADGARIAAGANMSAGQMFFEAEESYDAEECDFRP